MADTQNMTQAITQAAIEAIRTAVQVMTLTRVEAGTELRSESISMGPKIGIPTLKQTTVTWSPTDQSKEFRNIKLEMYNIFQTYNTNNADKVNIIKNWLGRQGLQFLESITQEEHE